MRRMNPPQDHIENAMEIEKYLRPTTIASIYAVFAILFAALTILVWTVLVRSSVLTPTPMIVTIFSIIGIFPVAYAILAVLIRPHDPVSAYLTKLSRFWRRPLDVPPEECTFTESLMDGETLCTRISFCYPLKYRTQDVRERLYSYVNAALARECSNRLEIPTDQEIEQIIDPALETLASEGEIPVLYSEVKAAFKLPRPIKSWTNDLVAASNWRTGTGR